MGDRLHGGLPPRGRRAGCTKHRAAPRAAAPAIRPPVGARRSGRHPRTELHSATVLGPTVAPGAEAGPVRIGQRGQGSEGRTGHRAPARDYLLYPGFWPRSVRSRRNQGDGHSARPARHPTARRGRTANGRPTRTHRRSGRRGPGPDPESRGGDSNRLKIPLSSATLKLPKAPHAYNRCNLRNLCNPRLMKKVVSGGPRSAIAGLIGRPYSAILPIFPTSATRHEVGSMDVAAPSSVPSGGSPSVSGRLRWQHEPWPNPVRTDRIASATRARSSMRRWNPASIDACSHSLAGLGPPTRKPRSQGTREGQTPFLGTK
jgi:hypothetical protein